MAMVSGSHIVRSVCFLASRNIWWWREREMHCEIWDHETVCKTSIYETRSTYEREVMYRTEGLLAAPKEALSKLTSGQRMPKTCATRKQSNPRRQRRHVRCWKETARRWIRRQRACKGELLISPRHRSIRVRNRHNWRGAIMLQGINEELR